jgi:ribonuclease E
VIVQVVRDGIGRKGPLLTTNLSIAGRCLVLMPHDDVRGVSRKVEDESARDGIREKLEQLDLPDGQGAIVRTNAIDQPKTALNRDLNALQRLWKRVRTEAATGKGPKLLYSDQDLILQVLRDSLDSSIQEVLVDDDEAFEKVQAYMRTFMPRAKTKLVRYTDRMPLFSRFQLESQIDSIYQQRVDLPSGGGVVIQRTEALTSIDVNSGRATRGSSQEETAHTTNLEAATEVARQLRLRDIGGLVVVDLIDMRSTKHRREVERALRDAMKDDKARFTVGRISPNGLIEINRQRLKKELTLRTHRIDRQSRAGRTESAAADRNPRRDRSPQVGPSGAPPRAGRCDPERPPRRDRRTGERVRNSGPGDRRRRVAPLRGAHRVVPP